MGGQDATPSQCKFAQKQESKKAICRCDRLPFFVVISSDSSKESQLIQQKGKCG